MDNLYWLDRIQPSERFVVGDKALHLSQLWQRGYPVVSGFVVPAIAFWEFVERLSESEPSLADLPYSSLHINVDNPHQLQGVAQHIRQGMTTATLPPTWETEFLTAAKMVPGSALILQPSLALPGKGSPVRSLEDVAQDLQGYGLLQSYISLQEPEALLQALKQVWAELFRARSLFYLQRVGIGLHQLNLAVLVQPLYDAIASGIVQANPERCQVQGTWGLGLAITKGEVLPDSYQIQVKTGKVLGSQLGSKTLAYRLGRPGDSSREGGSGEVRPERLYLQAYPVSEEHQKQYALEDPYLQQLIDLSGRLTAELTTTFSLEWTVCQIPDHLEPELYVTQFRPQSSSSSQPFIPSFTPTPLRGLPAAAGRVTALAQVITGNNQNLEAIAPGKILVAQSITPDWLPWLQMAAGVVTEQGGMTCHAAIVARELGIPAVVSVAGVTQRIQTGELLLVDGDLGEIQQLGTGTRKLGNKGVGEQGSKGDSILSYPPFAIATQLFVNLSQTQSLERIQGLPIDGLGLLRSELMILDALEHLPPREWLRQGRERELVSCLAELIIQFAAAFTPQPVFYRALDWHEAELAANTSPDLRNTSLEVPTVHSLLRQGATHGYQRDSAGFDVELAALGEVYARGYSNVRLILPFVRTVEEFAFCRRRVEQAGLMDNPHFQLWIMAEVPSVLFLLPDYVKAGVQGISIGTNDLTQLLLATDRNQGELGSILNGRHPAVMRAIQQLIQTARSAGIPCSICGQVPTQYPEIIDALVEWGITSISVDVHDVERIYSAIARAEQRLIVEAARQRLALDKRDFRG